MTTDVFSKLGFILQHITEGKAPLLTAWEEEFVNDVSGYASPSEKQLAVLDKIYSICESGKRPRRPPRVRCWNNLDRDIDYGWADFSEGSLYEMTFNEWY